MNSLDYNSIIDTINKYELLKLENIKLTSDIEKNTDLIKTLEKENKILQDEQEHGQIYTEKLSDDIKKLMLYEIENKDKKLSKYSEHINILENENEQSRIFTEKLYDDIMKLTSEIENKDKKLSEQSNCIKTMQNEIENKENRIKTLEKVIESKEVAINSLQNDIERKGGYIKDLEIVINCYQKFSNRDNNLKTDFSNLTQYIFDLSSSVIDNEYETIVVNNIMKAKCVEFLWKDIATNDSYIFDLYKSFDEVIKHLNKNYIFVQHNYHRELVGKQLTNIQKLKDDEYFIGGYYGNILVTQHYLQGTTDTCSYNVIFYTNYGNIIDFSFSRIIVCGGGIAPIINKIEYYYNNKKMNVTFINHLNLIIAKRESRNTSFIDITAQELNNIIKSLYGVISHSIINCIPGAKINDRIGWRGRESVHF